jgi:hypothetical protein
VYIYDWLMRKRVGARVESVTVLQLIDRWVEHCSELLSHNDPIDMSYMKAELLKLGSRSPPELALDRDFAMDELLIALSAIIYL